jgi:Ca-activated chloride channel family protein
MQKFLSLIFLLFSLNVAYAQTNPQVMLILDASGSMWGQVEGRDKISVAKEVLINNISSWNESVNLGLIVFGHNTQGSEIIMPLGFIDESKMLQKLQNINPKTEGSISHALIQAAKAMDSEGKKATVVLVSDGQNSCSVDPCNTAKILEEEGIDFRVHVIGFGVSDKAKAQLKCIADVSGGTYISADSVIELEDALKTITQQAQSLDEVPKNKNIRITASEEKNSKPIRALHTIYKIVNGKIEDKESAKCYSKANRACIRHLDKGLYRVITNYKGIKKENLLLVDTDELLSLHVNLKETGRVEIIATKNRAREHLKAEHVLYKILNNKVEKNPTAKCTSDVKDSCLGRIATGTYLIKTTANSITRENKIKVVTGVLNSININMGESAKIEIISRSKDKSLHVEHKIYKIGEDEPIASCSTHKDKSCIKSLLAGKYIVISTANGVEKKSRFSLRDGESSRVRVVFSSTDNR